MTSNALTAFASDAERLLDDPHAIGTRLGALLAHDGWLAPEHRVGNAEHYTQHLLHVSSCRRLSIVALVWLPGQRTPVHDHVSWCVVGVYEGEEAEVRYRLDGTGEDRHLVATGTGINPHGSTCGFAPPGDLHEVANAGNSKAISIHVYG